MLPSLLRPSSRGIAMLMHSKCNALPRKAVVVAAGLQIRPAQQVLYQTSSKCALSHLQILESPTIA